MTKTLALLIGNLKDADSLLQRNENFPERNHLLNIASWMLKQLEQLMMKLKKQLKDREKSVKLQRGALKRSPKLT
jgi:cell shape-determining protein MreC